MKKVDIKVHLIAKSSFISEEARKWLDDVGAENYNLPVIDEDVTNAEAVIGLAAKRCYLSFEAGLNPNVNKVRKDWTEYFNNVMASGHGSVFEHATFTFAIEGVSRIFTGEMNRHRAGVSISEGSMRYIRLSDISFWIPPSLQANENDDIQVREKKEKTLKIFEEVINNTEEAYKELVKVWGLDDENVKFDYKKKATSLLRRIIPMGVATGGVWTMNARALRHILALRSTPHAEEEIAYVMSMIAKLMVESEPRLFGDFCQDENGFWYPKYVKI